MKSGSARPRLWSAALILWMVPSGCRVGGPEGEADGGADGAGDEGAGACSGCHGGAENAAPPAGLTGETETTQRAVGAHQAHLMEHEDDWHAPVPCAECHRVPEDVEAEGHIGMAPAELTWGPRAMRREATPSFDGVRCTNVYCHGAVLLPGGSNTAPQWSVVDGTQAACGTCHGLPPDPPHPQNPQCETCHPQRYAQPTVYHINGEVEVAGFDCSGCHGSEGNPAPPPDTSGNSETTAVGVGAHQSHLARGADWHADVACAECHVVPPAVTDEGHVDTALPAELTWGELATSGGAAPDFDGESCEGVYCHGATLSGGSLTAPSWTTVDGTQAVCGTCHGLPPAEGHPPSGNCSFCHPSVVDDGRSIIAPALHINGRVDF
jgi:predicted CxxxxCH...CXXCH cytochrome family protein